MLIKLLKALFLHRDLVLLGVVLILIVALYQRRVDKTTLTVGVPAPTVSLPSTTTVTVPVLQPAQVVSDPKDKATIASLLAELKAAKLTPVVVTATTATEETHGTLEPTVVTNTVQVPSPFSFKDWHLTVQSDGKDVTYDLHQSFIVETATGRDKSGTPYSAVKLFEIGPGDTRQQLTAETREANVDETVPHLMAGFSIQAGPVIANEKGSIVVLQWLKHGRTDNPRDLKWAFVSPGFFFSSAVKEFGLLPISANVATMVRHQPFTNVWFSPYIGFSVLPSPHVSRVGGGLTFTF